MTDPMTPLVGSTWQHQNGTDYNVLGYTVREADGEKLISYQSTAGGNIWSRPLREFLANKEGKPRFVALPQNTVQAPTWEDSFSAKYPNLSLESQAKVAGSQEVGRFLEWLTEKGIYLAHYGFKDRLDVLGTSITDILYQFYGIDRKEVEKERQKLLDDFVARRDAGIGHGG